MHVPVLFEEVIEYLNPQPNENFIDCTINGGGHSLKILEKIKPQGRILGIDWDEKAIGQLKNKIIDQDKNNFVLVCDNYSNLKNIVKENNFYPINGILFDLGMSSWDIEASGRGFSFLKNEPLDMRYNENSLLTAKEVVNKWSEEKLIDIFSEYGEERRARAIAKSIIWSRKIKPINTTIDLADILKKSAARFSRHSRIHPATRIFQALRIAVNNELGNLENGLKSALEILAPNGRLAVISFHSLEDRIVKNFFREAAKAGQARIMTKKPIIATEEEIFENPRARSAKLRVFIKNSDLKGCGNEKMECRNDKEK